MEKLFSGWARNKFINCKIYKPKSLLDLKKFKYKSLIPRGMGRSYGDSSLKKKSILLTENLNKLLSLDIKNKIVEVESGIKINDLLKILIPKKLFLPVTPGSKFISIGGMVASDVHGKNHHNKGSFRHYIEELKIIDEKGKIHICSKKKNKNLFNYTIGGMGLTGIIYSCKFKLISIKSDLILQEKIKTNNLKQTIKKLKESKGWEYNVGWIDTSAKYSSLGRSIIFKGKHVNKHITNNLKFSENSSLDITIKFPSFLMNYFTIRFLNFFYYLLNFKKKSYVKINDYFYQLDKIKNWNLIYGKKGFISYQLVIPEKKSYFAIKQILEILIKNNCFSFVSVIKFLGRNDGYNSFGKKGYTLVFDFPIYKNIYLVLKKVNEIVIKNNGNLYLCKDSILNRHDFKKMNNLFYDKKYQKIRKSKKKYFYSEQSYRLDI